MDYFNPNDYWNQADKDQYKGMTDKEKLRAGCWQMIIYIVAIAIGMIVCSFFTSCKETEYITVPELHKVHHHHTDSVRLTDSIYHEKETVVMQLDSAAMARYGIQLKAAERAWLVRTAELERQLQRLSENHTDTMHKVDSVPYPVEVPVEVPAQLTWWQQTRLHLANILLYLLAICGVIWICKSYIKKFLP